MTPSPPRFASTGDYGPRLADVGFWRPYIEMALHRHGLPCAELRLGAIGTFPTFMVDGRHFVKLYGDLLGGHEDFRMELACYRLLQGHEAIAMPQLVASGVLFPGEAAWSWPYLITTALPGQSVADVWEQMTGEDKLHLAHWLGGWTRTLHAIPLQDASVLAAEWRAFAALLRRSHAAALEEVAQDAAAPHWLAAQLDTYLGPPNMWLDPSARPVLLHADLHADHIFVEQRGGRWQPTGVIDFGDAVAGDWSYELPALHLDAFRGDKRLLNAYLEGYGVDAAARRGVARQGLRYTILHEFAKITEQLERFPKLRELTDLESVERVLWDVTDERMACCHQT